MKLIKREVFPLFAMLAFISAYIGAAEAKTYYFATLPGLVDDSVKSYPFCEVGDCTYDNETGVTLSIVTPSIFVSTDNEINNSYNLSGTADISLSVTDEDVISVNDLVLDEVNKTIYIASESVENTGAVQVLITAKVDGTVVAQDFFDVVISDWACTPGNPLNGMDISGSTYLLGGYAASPDLAKDQLLCISQNQTTAMLAASYALTTDVDFGSNESSVDWDGSGSAGDGTDAEGWISLGSAAGVFMGTFNGGLYEIENLFIDRDVMYQGFIGVTNGSIKNIGITSADITGLERVGIVAGQSASSSISNVYSSGTVSSTGTSVNSYVGGVVGYAGSSSVSGSYSTATVIGQGTSKSFIGGLVGYMGNADIYNSYALGSVTATGNSDVRAGGLVGKIYGSVNNSYASGAVSASGGSSYAGGLVGKIGGEYWEGGATINNSYAIWLTAPTAGSGKGGLAGSSSYLTVHNYNNLCSGAGESTPTVCTTSNAKLIKADYTNGLWSDSVWARLEDAEPALEWENPLSYTDSNLPMPQHPSACLSDDPFEDMDVESGKYLIGNLEANATTAKRQLLCLSQAQTQEVLEAKYKLMVDVNFGTYSAVDWDGDSVADGTSTEGWKPLGSVNPFSGDFDGNNHKITGVYIKRLSESQQGFFGFAEDSEIKNLELENVNIYAFIRTGGLAGTVNNCEIDNVHINGGSVRSVQGRAGGAIAAIEQSLVTNSSSSATVQAVYNPGGFAGLITGGLVENCYSTGAVTCTNWYTGGFTSAITRGTVRNSYSTGAVYSSNYYGGGFVGTMYDATIENVYATGAITGSRRNGGLVGHAKLGFKIINSYSTSSIGGYQNLGGLLGWWDVAATDGLITDSYAINASNSMSGTGEAPSSTVCSDTKDDATIGGLGCVPMTINSGWDPSVWSDVGISNTPTLTGLPN